MTNAEAADSYLRQGQEQLVFARQSASVGDGRLASSYARKAAEAFDIAATYGERNSDAQADEPSKGRPIPHVYEARHVAEVAR
ncbi:hypothetical protein [Polyangium sp. y55x31]|uniref:hypothetical protein n=1 Tax=Polyangium sp. y55x31 TaxID=3042688 RepID=UPI0024822D31|nr:hypothetical protein [Polyangium sp. y55x31]MDI1475403.1 hypothetical protein [Polyangium sp. y55x31]